MSRIPAACIPRAEIKWRLAMLGVLALAALLFFVRLGTRSLWTMEVRWAEIPREMQRSGNYFRPTINGHLYYDKPLASYWLILAASRVTGAVDETSARLPSAICGLLAVGLCMRLAQQLSGDRTAVLTGVILTTSFSFVDFSRTASADMESVAGQLAALVVFMGGRRRPNGWWVILLWLIMALTSLTKGLLGFALPLLIMATFSSALAGNDTTAERRSWLGRLVSRNRWFFNRQTLVAVALAAVVYFLPFVLSRDGDRGLALVFRENIQRFFAPVNHRGPVYLYAGVIFVLLAPWSALLPAALIHAHRRDGPADEGRRFTLIWFWLTFAFFTLSASRRSYYLLPILPAGALLVARLLTAGPANLARATRALLALGLVVVALLTLAAGLALVPRHGLLPEQWAHLPDIPARAIFAVFWIVSLAALLCALVSLRTRRIGAALATMAVLSMAYVFLFALPAGEAFRGEKSFARDVRRLIDGDTSGLALLRTRELVFYLNLPEPLKEYECDDSLGDAIRQGRIRWLVLRERDLFRLKQPYIVVASTPTVFWDGGTAKTRALLVRFGREARAPLDQPGKGG